MVKQQINDVALPVSSRCGQVAISNVISGHHIRIVIYRYINRRAWPQPEVICDAVSPNANLDATGIHRVSKLSILISLPFLVAAAHQHYYGLLRLLARY